MDAITLVFTGLIIFDANGFANFVTADNHQTLVVVEQGGTTTFKEVRKSISIGGMTAGPVGITSGFGLPPLTSVFTGALSVDPKKVKSLEMNGGVIAPYRGHAICKAAGSKPTLFWEGFQWTVNVKSGTELLIDAEPLVLKDNAIVRISNNYSGATSTSHVMMYKKALKDQSVTYTAPVCGEPYPVPTPEPKSTIEYRKNNPVTCPPMSLQ